MLVNEYTSVTTKQVNNRCKSIDVNSIPNVGRYNIVSIGLSSNFVKHKIINSTKSPDSFLGGLNLRSGCSDT